MSEPISQVQIEEMILEVSDASKLVFASNRYNRKEGDTNIFIADWVD